MATTYCLFGIYRQLNSILKPSYYIQKSSKIIFNGSVINCVYYIWAIGNLDN